MLSLIKIFKLLVLSGYHLSDPGFFSKNKVGNLHNVECVPTSVHCFFFMCSATHGRMTYIQCVENDSIPKLINK